MSDRDYADIADPELIARLASWFGEGPLPPPDVERIERDAREATIAELEAVIDTDLRDRLEAQRETADELLIWADAPIERTLDPSISRTNLPAGPLETDEPEREYEQPNDVRFALRDDNTPQAVLRDLYRPVRFFGDVEYRIRDLGDATVVKDPTSVAREAMASSWGADSVEPAQSLIEVDMSDLRSRLNEPWEESAVDPATLAVDDDEADLYRWFGLEGGYDPDL